MKKKLLLMSILSIAYVAFQSSINGVTTAQQLDRTNSPLNAGNCSSCHSGGNFESNMTIELIDKNNQSVKNYAVGETYTVRYTINATGAAKFGLQSTILASDSSSAGTLTAKSANSQIVSLNNRTYLDHKTASTTNVFEANWVAPAVLKGDIKIYSSALAANGDNGTIGDKQITESPFVISPSASGLKNQSLTIKVYPNPTTESINIESNITPNTIEIYSLTGSLVLSANNTKTLNTNLLDNGIYLLKVKIGDQIFQQKILKN
jgi:hypothetical protein